MDTPAFTAEEPGPTRGDGVFETAAVVTPDPAGGLLEGTARRDVFTILTAQGVPTRVRNVPVAEPERADSAWITSAGALAVPGRGIDGRSLSVDRVLTGQISTAVLARTR